MKSLLKRATKELFVILLICGTFLVSYFLFSFASFYLNTSAQYTEILERRKINLDKISNSFEYLLQDNPNSNLYADCDFESLALPAPDLLKLKHLTNLLTTLTQAGNINFSLLKYQGKTLFNTRGSTSSCTVDPALEADYPIENQVLTLKTVMIRTIAHDSFKITMGIPLLGGKHVVQEFLSSIKVFFNDTLSLTLILFIIIAYYLNDLIFLYRIIGKSDWKELLRERAFAKGSKTVVRFLYSILTTNDKLETENQRLKHGFESAYLRHIESDELQKKLNNVVYIELDWKDHTPYLNKYGLEAIIEIRNQINHIGRVLVSRYNGLMLEAKSDMLSFIVDRGTLLENKQLALSCVRDFFKAMDFLETQLSEREIKIKYRGTMVVGDFEFQQTSHNYNLNSEVYYISSRLSKASNTSGHHLTVLTKDTEGLDSLFELTEPISESLKGLGVHSYCEIKNFHSIDYVLNKNHWNLLRFFRGENDMIKILKFSADEIENNNLKDAEDILKQIRDFHLDEFLITEDIPEIYLHLLGVAIKNGKEPIIAAISSLSKVLFSANMNNQQVEDYFRQAANTHWPRVRANMVESYNQLTDYRDQEWNSSHFQFDNNRVKGNVIIAACQDEVNEFYRAKIKDFLESKNERYIATGLFLLGHLYRLFYLKNKIYFLNNEWFKKIPEEIRPFTLHPNIMIQSRAKDELQKILSLN